MLNRRQVRRKVLQQLYAFKQQSDSLKGDDIAGFDKKLQKSFSDLYQLFLFQLDTLKKIHDNVGKKIELENKKFAPNKSFVSVLEFVQDNHILQHISKNVILTDKVSKLPFNIDSDNVTLLDKLSGSLLQSEKLVNIPQLKEKSPKEKSEFLFDFYDEHIAGNEEVHETYLQNNLNWVDDIALVNTMTLKYLKNIKETDDEYTKLPIEVSDIDTTAFGRKLFIKTINRWDELNLLIDKEIKNWEIDRLAFMDLLIIKMAITEFYDFIDIPVKVSINEYIEIAKDYSSPKSSKFINGVLDKIQNKLIDEKAINKVKA
jgi:N utilization substance protein B